MTKLIIANWKLNPRTKKEAVNLARSSDFKNVVISPPFIFLDIVINSIKKASLGAQDVFWEKVGAYTGEVSAIQLKSLGVEYVIIGHSERRRWFNETDEMINKKIKAALKAGLKVVLCVGEDWQIRKKGLNAAKNFVKNQLQKGLKDLTHNLQLTTHNLLIAYEPIWAIGTGKNDTPKDVAEMAKFIKKLSVISYQLSVKVLYGGSVTAKNIKAFLTQKEIDGALVGGASLKVKEFKRIILFNEEED